MVLGESDSGDNDIVISGISGRFPQSKNMQEFADNLYNKVDMVNGGDERWKHFHPEVPKRTGKINGLEKFDASFFSIGNQLADSSDPQGRILLEHAYEAILDAGVSPQSLIGSRTGVFIGCNYSDSKDQFLFKQPTRDGNALNGNANFYIANRISHALGLCGPSLVTDTACSSSAYSLDVAFKYIKSGECDAALVGGTQLITNLFSTTEYNRLRVLASDGFSRTFDKKASGFTRADAICVVFLQKQKDSKRIYANLLTVATNNDGFKPEGTAFPSRIIQQQLFEECFKHVKMGPSDFGYVEAHSTGTFIGDAEEIAAIDAAYCQKRSKPLAVGSVKSNMGHSEATSALSSTAKLILALEKGKIAPNINLDELRDDVPAFNEGRIRVVTEVEDLESPYVSLNSFGLGGANAHVLFKGNTKSKINKGIPSDEVSRLLCWAGRTTNAVNVVFKDILSRPLDGEHLALLQNSQVKTSQANTFRGYGIFRHNESSDKAECVIQNICRSNNEKRPIVWVFSDVGSEWSEIGSNLMKIPAFVKSINRCHDALIEKGLNLKSIILGTESFKSLDVVQSHVGTVAIQIALIDVMRSIGIEPDFLVGHSVGEIAVAYADNCLTLEETILSSHARGQANIESKKIHGGFDELGMNHQNVRKYLIDDIDNDRTKEISCTVIPCRSRCNKEMGLILYEKLIKIIKTPKKRSKKWLSSTYPSNEWKFIEAQYSSAKYQTMNLLNPVLFQEVVKKLPVNAMTVEFSSQAILEPLLRRSMKEGIHLSLLRNSCSDHLMDTLGRIFQNGTDFDASKLYQPVDFPVSRGTPMISPTIEWDHSEDRHITKFNQNGEWMETNSYLINFSDREYDFLRGHVIDGKILYPGTGLLTLVWETFSMMNATPMEEFAVTFEDVKFLRATNLKENQDVILFIHIQKGNGNFEITEGQTLVAQGCIKQCDTEMITIPKRDSNDCVAMTEKDFYKEMRLRGYHHKDLFRVIEEVTIDGLEGKIKWNDNWTTFIDGLFQIKVLMKDTRLLVLPTKFRKLIINPLRHKDILRESNEGVIDILTCPYSQVTQAGGIEIHDFEGTPVNRRSTNVDLVIETYKFVPFDTISTFSKQDAAKYLVQLLLENSPTAKFSSVEVDFNDNKDCMNELIQLALEDLPSITSDLNYLTTKQITTEHVNVVEDKKLSDFKDVNVIVRSECVSDSYFLMQAESALKPGGFIVSREHLNTSIQVAEKLQLVATIRTNDESIVVLKFKQEFKKPHTIIQITSVFNDWLEPLKEAMRNGSVLIYAQNEELSGILGLANCLLRESPNIKCVFIADPIAPPFDINLPFYQKQLKLGLTINVYKQGQWGCYRHFQLLNVVDSKPTAAHVYANCKVVGDMSSINWFSGPLTQAQIDDPNCIKISYTAINFRDVMQASGKISFNFLTRVQIECFIGFEFSGITQNGQRVMGIGTQRLFSTYIPKEESICWNVPDHMSLEEAATIPLVYATVYIAFFHEVIVKSGESVLIHAGSGGVGIAALHIAFYYGLEVFTTVSTKEKSEYLLSEFPLLKPENIGNSRDTSFEQMIARRTKGKGVNYVLNSLSQDKLFASIRCLAQGGTFLEIGKFDIMNKTQIDLSFCAKEISIKAIFIQGSDINNFGVEAVVEKMTKDLEKGIIKPLKANDFPASEIQQAFRFLASGKHIGKVLVKIRENEDDLESLPMSVANKVFCEKHHSYVIVGGLGGFGLELADWLILAGCQNLVLVSSRGVTNGYQAVRMKLWESYGVKVRIDTSNITTRAGCMKILKSASVMGAVGGIFNLAVALRDGLFENQTAQMFEEAFDPKAIATKHLDEVSKELCPELKHFVIFSSVSCGRGNAGQSNYGMANSVMERIIERRHELNLPAKAIQFGAVGDVGLLADVHEKNIDMQISGTLPQSIRSCLQVLDQLLTSEEPIVTSMVVAEKKFSDSKKGDIIELLCSVLGIRDKKSISMDSSLSKLGMDSLMTIEITQFLEREFNLTIPLKELQSMSLYDLQQRTKSNNRPEDVKGSSLKHRGIEIVLSSISTGQTNREMIVCLNEGNVKSCKTLIIPGIEGILSTTWKQLGERLNGPTYLLQWNFCSGAKTIKDIHDQLIKCILGLFSDEEHFCLIGYSFGSLLTLEVAKTLELRGMNGKVLMIDGSPLYLKKFGETFEGTSEVVDATIQFEIIKSFIRIHFPDDIDLIKRISSKEDWTSKINEFVQIDGFPEDFDADYTKNLMTELVDRCKMIASLNASCFPYLATSQVSLVKPTDQLVDDIDEAYGLNVFCSQNVQTKSLQGNHLTILYSYELTDFVNALLRTELM